MSRVSFVRIARVLLFAVPISVVAIGFLAPLWVAYDYAVLSPGDTVRVIGSGIPDPSAPAGPRILHSIDGDTAIVTTPDGRHHSVPVSSVVER